MSYVMSAAVTALTFSQSVTKSKRAALRGSLTAASRGRFTAQSTRKVGKPRVSSPEESFPKGCSGFRSVPLLKANRDSQKSSTECVYTYLKNLYSLTDPRDTHLFDSIKIFKNLSYVSKSFCLSQRDSDSD